MGQLIEVSSTAIGDVAIFDTDRSITGQDGHEFAAAPPGAEDPPALLATRLFQSDESIEHIHVLSNTVSVRRDDGWSDDSLKSAREVIARLFVFYDEDSDPYESLRQESYNATIGSIREHNDDLWVIQVEPDEPLERYEAGQYTTLALGFWEPRADDAEEDLEPDQIGKLARRSYSVSSPIVDRVSGELVPAQPEAVEFYIVRVPPALEEIPALTPRLFTKAEGDRIFMGRKFTGRYNLDDVETEDRIVLLSTGTGEAPQNAMVAELLRRGHTGPILNLVCVRYRDDLAYLPEQEIVEEKWPNYQYGVLTTREPEDLENKRYIQDLLRDGDVEEMLGAALDPDRTHVFLCGNPAMIGLPEWGEDGDPVFPKPVGVCELLYERGFTIDRGKDRGNVHYEEYWTDS